eukprot:Rhum_TRINITY_DN14731_c4_g1::Rhum_TRINITY_DN14731_c4_g1_i1::g.115363::m.115363
MPRQHLRTLQRSDQWQAHQARHFQRLVPTVLGRRVRQLRKRGCGSGSHRQRRVRVRRLLLHGEPRRRRPVVVRSARPPRCVRRPHRRMLHVGLKRRRVVLRMRQHRRQHRRRHRRHLRQLSALGRIAQRVCCLRQLRLPTVTHGVGHLPRVLHPLTRVPRLRELQDVEVGVGVRAANGVEVRDAVLRKHLARVFHRVHLHVELVQKRPFVGVLEAPVCVLRHLVGQKHAFHVPHRKPQRLEVAQGALHVKAAKAVGEAVHDDHIGGLPCLRCRDLLLDAQVRAPPLDPPARHGHLRERLGAVGDADDHFPDAQHAVVNGKPIAEPPLDGSDGHAARDVVENVVLAPSAGQGRATCPTSLPLGLGEKPGVSVHFVLFCFVLFCFGVFGQFEWIDHEETMKYRYCSF